MFTLEDARAADFESLLALRLRAMRESLEQLGRYDEDRARARLAAAFDPSHTWHVVVAGQRVGFLVLKRLTHTMRLDHLYIDPAMQRRGIGGAVLRRVCDEADAQLLPIELCALKGSAANRFYLQHGFVQTGEGEWDNDYHRAPLTRGLRAVRALWAAMQARDWAAARAGLHAQMQAVWWTSGERFVGADAFIAVQSRYYLHTIECFGPDRCMFESNFPVDRFSLSYRTVWNAFKKLTVGFGAAERDAMFAGTARRIYRLD